MRSLAGGGLSVSQVSQSVVSQHLPPLPLLAQYEAQAPQLCKTLRVYIYTPITLSSNERYRSKLMILVQTL